MESLKSFRSKYGFTQQTAAHMLGVSLAHIAMAETGKRKLPKNALEKLAELETLSEAALTDKQTAKDHTMEYVKLMKQEYTLTLKGLLPYDKECNYQIQTLKRKLSPLQVRRDKAVETLALLVHIRTTQKLSKAELISIRKAESDAKRVLKLIPQITIEKLNFQVEALEFISEKIEEKMNELNELVDML